MSSEKNDKSKSFSFDDVGIAEIFKDYTLTIPAHQRDYAWTDEEVDKLFSDLESAQRKGSEYFLGTIVAIKESTSGPLQVVDGQQRLTTIYLLLAAIRDYLLKNGIGETLSNSLQTSYLFTTDRREGFTQRLTLNTDDRQFFKDLTQKDHSPDWPPLTNRTSHKLLKSAYFKAKDRVELIANSVSGVDAPDTFNNWIDYLEFSAQVILLRAQDHARAFKMFETLNDRGLRTSQADLVKSYLFGLATSNTTAAQTYWSTMLENLQELGDDDPQVVFLRHYLIAFSAFVRADGVYEAIQKRFNTNGKATSFLSSLATVSKIYVATYNSEHEYWNKHPSQTRRYLSDFNFFDLNPLRPLLLALASEFKPKEFARSIKFLTALSVRLVITSRTRSGVNEQAFSEAASDVSSREITTHAQLLEALEKISVSDKDFRTAFANARVSKAPLARYYLREIENFLKGDSKSEHEWVNADPSQITLEHILNKTFPASGWGEFDKDLHMEYRHRIGNLCLLKRSENNGMSNESFSKKLEVFKNSSLKVTSGLTEYAKWDPANIESRQEWLADLAINTWALQ